MSQHHLLLTAQQRILLDLLCCRSPIPTERLITNLYADRHDGGPETAWNVVRIQIQRLRKRLEPHNVKILTLPGRGYMVDPHDIPAVESLRASSLDAEIACARAM